MSKLYLKITSKSPLQKTIPSTKRTPNYGEENSGQLFGLSEFVQILQFRDFVFICIYKAK